MLKKLVLGCAVVLAGFLVYVAMQPSQMNVSRELLVRATPEAIFPHINNTKKADEWMPWREVDPEVQMKYSGPEEGLGSTSSWSSSGQMGTGLAVIVESIPNESVKTSLSYTKPMVMTQLAELSLRPTPEGTIVRWAVNGNNNFMGRLFCVLLNMDTVVGKQFEQGLNKLKSIVETKTKKLNQT